MAEFALFGQFDSPGEQWPHSPSEDLWFDVEGETSLSMPTLRIPITRLLQHPTTLFDRTLFIKLLISL
jgi:hypothetical protein